MNLVGLHRGVEHHVEEVRAVGEVVPGVDHRFADRLLVGEGRHRPDDRNQPRGGLIDILRQRLEVDVGIEGRQRVDHRREDMHRVRSPREVIEEVAHVLVEHRVDVEHRREVAPLLLVRQFAVDQQIGYLDEHGLADQLLDRNPPVAENPLLAVDEGDAAVAGGGVHEARVKRDVTGFTAQRTDIDTLLAFRTDHHRQPDRLAFDFQHHVTGTLLLHSESSFFTEHSRTASLLFLRCGRCTPFRPGRIYRNHILLI